MDLVPRMTNELNGTPILEGLAMPERTAVA